MKTAKNFNIYIVIGNILYGQSLKQFLEINLGSNIQIQTFAKSESCINKIGSWEIKPNIIILDQQVNVTTVNGQYAADSIKQMSPKTNIIILYNKSDIKIAILNLNSCDYLAKDSFTFSHVLNSVQKYLPFDIKIDNHF